MKRLLTLSMLFCLGQIFAQDYSKITIYTNSQGLQRLAELGLPVDHGEWKKDYSFTSDFSTDEIEVIANNGFLFDVVIPDVKAFYKARNENPSYSTKNTSCAGGTAATAPTVPVNFETSAASYAGFYQYQEMLDALDAMAAQYPTLISVKAPISTFQTWEGRYIYHVKISDNPSTDEAAEPKVLYTAIHHAREPMSMSQTIFYMWYLLENYATNEEIQFLVNNTEMYFVPCLNPDGYIHNQSQDPSGFGMHRKNKNPSVGTTNPGVDLNRNYSYGWNTTGVSTQQNNDTYPGSGAFSEPETQAMQWLVESVGFKSAFNAHTYGNTLLYPIGTTTAEFADHDEYFSQLAGHMCSQNGYFPQKSSGLYPASGDSDDYMYKVDNGVGQKDTIFVMTPEIGTGFWPAQSEVIPTCQGMVFPNMVLSHITHQYYLVDETDPSSIVTMTGNFNHDARRLGFEDGIVTVSIEPLVNIQSVGTSIDYNLDIKAIASNAISFVLEPTIQFGDEIKYILKTEYIGWTRKDTIIKKYGALTTQFVEDGTSAANWTGNWTTTTSDFVSSPRSFTDGTGDYSNNANKTTEFNQVIDLTNATDAAVSFYAKWEIEADYDFCQFQVSTDGGSNWIGQCGNYTVAGSSVNGTVQPTGDPVYEGFQTSWVLEEISLSDYIGQTIKVRFQLRADGGLNEDGFYFDDFTIAYNIDAAGLNEFAFDAKVFPNPANNELTISTSKPIGAGVIQLVDQNGKVVLQKNIEGTSNMFVLQTAQLSNGIYSVFVGGENEFAQPMKVVVMH
jgi:carboxypeptidase T